MLETQLLPDAPAADESTTDSRRTKHLRYAIVPSNGRSCLDGCVEALLPQVDKVLIINTTETGFLQFPMRSPNLDQVYSWDEDINISRWWNQGLVRIHNYVVTMQAKQRLHEITYDVAIVNDDCIVPEGWVAAVAGNMRQHGAVAGCSGGHDIILRTQETVPLDMRMQGFAFILAGERGMRANELYPWFYSDDYIDWESRLVGGMAMVRGFPVTHLYPNGQVTPQIHQLNADGAATFYASYGRMPH